jgi:hypothetical protein
MSQYPVRSLNKYLILSVALFVAVLAISAYLEKSIRILHLFEAIPYLLVPWIFKRNPKVGSALAFASGAFWIWTAGFLTTFVRNGFERVGMLIETGTVDRPDILLAVPAFIGTMSMVIIGLTGYSRVHKKSLSDLRLFPGMFLLIFIYFILIFYAFAPQYLGMFGIVLSR